MKQLSQIRVEIQGEFLLQVTGERLSPH